jgi:hypothetical protein
LKRITAEYGISDVSPEQLMSFYRKTVKTGMEQFLMIDTNTNDPKLKNRVTSVDPTI